MTVASRGATKREWKHLEVVSFVIRYQQPTGLASRDEQSGLRVWYACLTRIIDTPASRRDALILTGSFDVRRPVSGSFRMTCHTTDTSSLLNILDLRLLRPDIFASQR